MSYNGWKLMDKVDVAVRDGEANYHGFTGYMVEHGDEKALASAKDWATITPYDREKGGYLDPIEPKVHTFDNEGFNVKILNSADGSSQGGRLSFWRCEVEKDGIKFTIGVNDEILAGLIKSSDISNGIVLQKVMFARKAGQTGLLHEGMEMYKDAVADMEHKATMKSAKKTTKWEVGGVYQTITKTAICLGEVWDTMEEVEEQVTDRWYRPQARTELVKRDKPVKVLAWSYLSSYGRKEGAIPTFNEFVKDKIGDGTYIWFETGKPPSRTKTEQLDVTEEDLKLIDKLLSLNIDHLNSDYGSPTMKGRFVRELK